MYSECIVTSHLPFTSKFIFIFLKMVNLFHRFRLDFYSPMCDSITIHTWHT